MNKAHNHVMPTSTCFDDCLEFIEALLVNAKQSEHHEITKRFLVVHGIYRLTDMDNDHNTRGEPFAHGWVFDKTDKAAIQKGVFVDGSRDYYAVDVRDFYGLLRPVKETRYTLKEVHRLNIAHNNYGPWKQEYINLCKDKKGEAI